VQSHQSPENDVTADVDDLRFCTQLVLRVQASRLSDVSVLGYNNILRLAVCRAISRPAYKSVNLADTCHSPLTSDNISYYRPTCRRISCFLGRVAY